MPIHVVVIALAFAALVAGQHPAGARVVVSDAEMATSAEAREIAAGEGVRRFDAIRFNQTTGNWEIEGRDATDRPIELEIEANTGAIVRIIRRDHLADDEE